MRCPACHRRLRPGAACPSDGRRLATEPIPPRAAEAAPIVAGYRLGSELGAGGFGQVFAAIREADGAPAAIKIAHRREATSDARFQREVEALASIGAPHVPALFGHGELEDGRPYLAMERIEAPTLADELAALPGPPSVDWIAEVGAALLDAVAAAHDRGVVHRDLKPENVFVVRAPMASARLCDFGLAKSFVRQDPALTRADSLVGTPEYMAPEQLRNALAVDHRADLYALGVILFELATLRVPFVGTAGDIQRGHLALRPPRPRELAAMSAGFEALVLACLAKDPALRPQDCVSIRAALLRARAEEVITIASTAGKTGTSGPAHPQSRGPAQQPVVLAAVANIRDPSRVSEVIKQHQGVVARIASDLEIFGFSADASDEPVQAAREAAMALHVTDGAAVALHLAPLVVRRRANAAITFFGSAVERPESWLPERPWEGVIFSSDAAAVMPLDSVEQDPDRPGFYRPSADPGERRHDLFGRESTTARLTALWQTSARERTPLLITLLGDPGVGKSHLLEALRDAFATPLEGCPAPKAALLRLPRTTAGPGASSRRLLQDLLGLDQGASRGGMMDEGIVDGPSLGERLLGLAAHAPLGVFIDDLQLADERLLEALELATLEGARGALCICVTAHPRFEQMIRRWGVRAQRHERLLLEPLAGEPATQLAAALLRPAEYAPAAVLRRVVDWSGGIPGVMVDVVSRLKREGLVRKRSDAGSWYVASTAIDKLAAAPAAQWVARRDLALLGPDLLVLIRSCAVLGEAFSAAEVSAVLDALERSGAAGPLPDATAGLAELVHRGLLTSATDGQIAFRGMTLQEGIYGLMEREERRLIHAHALEYWRACRPAERETPACLERVARHAVGSGARAEAESALVRLAELAQQRNRYVEADRHYTEALEQIEQPRNRALALCGRATARQHAHRLADAREDLAAARALAEQLGDPVLVGETHLLEGDAFHSLGDTSGERACFAKAARIAEHVSDQGLEAGLTLSAGRLLVRDDRLAEALGELERAAELARSTANHERTVAAELLIAPILAILGQVERSRDRFAALIALCKESSSQHLATAYSNRLYLWIALNEPARALPDLQRAVRLAREAGHPLDEKNATLNMAALLFWSGDDAEALTLAQRALVIEDRLLPTEDLEAPLLIARIQASLGARIEALATLDRAVGQRGPAAPGTMASWLCAMIRLLAVPANDDGAHARRWDDLLEGARAIAPENAWLELAYFRAREAIERKDRADYSATMAQSEPLLARHDIWVRRFDALRARARDVFTGA